MKNKKFIKILPINTLRLIIRKTRLDDIDLLLKMDKQEDTQKYLGGIKNKTKEERLLFLENKIKKYNNGFASSLTVCLKDNTSVGFFELKINEENNYGEVSYIFDSDYIKNGYCNETLREILNISFNELNLDKVVAYVKENNISSIKVLEKNNFKLEKKEDFLEYVLVNSKKV